jgi:hypothetical protein
MPTELLEQEVEAAIVNAFNSELGTIATAYGFWQPMADGDVKEAGATHVSVRVSVRANASQNSRIVSLPVSIVIKCAVEDSANGDKLIDMAKPIVNLLHSWNLNSETMSTALSVSSVFRADGLVFQDGGDPDFDDALKLWYCPIQIKISGAILTT